MAMAEPDNNDPRSLHRLANQIADYFEALRLGGVPCETAEKMAIEYQRVYMAALFGLDIAPKASITVHGVTDPDAFERELGRIARQEMTR